ncbi:MAG TPA: VOC family protein [Hyphomicrobiaceae bacterium]|nr:VOC family protein [Hyphomicrobiaceae bacterium]
MIDHVSLAVADLDASRTFYTALLAPLGLSLLVERKDRLGFGKSYPEVWLNLRQPFPDPGGDPGAHICLRARTPEAVTEFHAKGIAHGGSSDGGPGPRQASMTRYFAAFIRDPDGNRIEAASFPAA